MIKFFKRTFTIVIFCVCVLGIFTFAYGEDAVKGVVIANDVNVRKEPKIESMVLNTLKLGDYVHIVNNNGEWYAVALNNKEIGWVHNQLIAIIDNEKELIKKGIVNVDCLNVREQPCINSDIIKKLPVKFEVTVFEKNANWYHIIFDDGSKGWVYSDYITIKPNYKKAKITASNVNLRRSPSDNGGIITTLPLDTYVKVKNYKNGWYNVITQNNKTGWIYKDYVKILLNNKPISRSMNRSSLGIKVVTIAKNLLGKKYVYGASGPNRFDCSGFTSYVYHNIGIKIPRTSSNQVRIGKKVSKSDLRAGDLVFFDTNGVNNGKISHVGIYIGNGQFIHASSGKKAKKVVISDLTEGYYKRTYVTARRVL
ncbi:SH3 domain-containing protein [Crassaminicella thermophila]|uniref:SH3 domain-containing protein n=1 Tax=Crassaminicella thermophila TaxID=2599308 RepID=A0A5C0SG25_CRATE|nr:SH3 domain-containing protein [Crassaminicella thermophila]QEK12324.1 SH3 domain-containing protein [Crassaminicella thermophila]